jgi:hypothetical protein
MELANSRCVALHFAASTSAAASAAAAQVCAAIWQVSGAAYGTADLTKHNHHTYGRLLQQSCTWHALHGMLRPLRSRHRKPSPQTGKEACQMKARCCTKRLQAVYAAILASYDCWTNRDRVQGGDNRPGAAMPAVTRMGRRSQHPC